MSTKTQHLATHRASNVKPCSWLHGPDGLGLGQNSKAAVNQLPADKKTIIVIITKIVTTAIKKISLSIIMTLLSTWSRVHLLC